jgi:hypothetical protein
MCTVVLVNLCLYAYFVLVYRIVYWIIPNCMLKNLVRTTPGLNAGSATEPHSCFDRSFKRRGADTRCFLVVSNPSAHVVREEPPQGRRREAPAGGVLAEG